MGAVFGNRGTKLNARILTDLQWELFTNFVDICLIYTLQSLYIFSMFGCYTNYLFKGKTYWQLKPRQTDVHIINSYHNCIFHARMYLFLYNNNYVHLKRIRNIFQYQIILNKHCYLLHSHILICGIKLFLCVNNKIKIYVGLCKIE